jgi:hypothetical protein
MSGTICINYQGKWIVNMLKVRLVSTIIFIGALIACADSGLAVAQSDPKSPYDPFIEPKTNINLMNEVIEKAVKDKFGEILSESYEINGIRADGMEDIV